MKPIILHPEALQEFDAAAAHYAKIDPALGQSFYNVIDQLIAEVCASPSTFRFYGKPARRHFTREFPYGIIYIERPDDIWIVAVMPLKREPGYWKARLTHLTCGAKFVSNHNILERQVLAALTEWLRGNRSFVFSRDISEIIPAKINVWLPLLPATLLSAATPNRLRQVVSGVGLSPTDNRIFLLPSGD